ncbi:MAG: hypothetical protein OXK73_03340 [Rhodospirillaceae bacterium]|nr:hypothetical protein [Rhodospirillaceae bacterium]
MIEAWPVWQFRLLDAAFELWLGVVVSGVVGFLVAAFVRFRFISRSTGELITSVDMVVALVSAMVVFGSLMAARELLGG